MALGTSIRTLMNNRRLSVAQVAEASGMDPQKVYYILKHDPISGDVFALKRLADAYGVTLDFFLEPVFDEASREARLLQVFRAAGEHGQEKIFAYAGDMEALHKATGD